MPIVCLALASTTSAEIVFDWIDVGDPGNPVNPLPKHDRTSGYGAVDYTFRLGKYETTNLQFTEFLNAVAATDPNELYDEDMASRLEGGITRTGDSGSYTYSVKPNMGKKPVNFVSWFDSARFANWLHNDQPVGVQDASTTEDGAYTFSGPDTVSTRKSGARFFLPDEHEWDKAAFYEPGADTLNGDGWWSHPSRSDIGVVFPSVASVDATGNVTNPGPNVVVFRRTANWNGSTSGNVATVGSAGNESYYGARDMPGNVFEWVTADPSKPDPNGWGPYTVRGGSFFSTGHLRSSERNLVHHHNHGEVSRFVGFRLAAASLDPDSADFNHDTLITEVDLELWEQSYGNSIVGDADNDGDTDGADFLAWQRQVAGGAPLTSAHTSVPEPTTLTLALLLLVGAGCIRSGKCPYHQHATPLWLSLWTL